MRTRLLVALLACVTGMASAGWTQLGVTSRAGTSYYLDLASMQEASGGNITVSYLVDLGKPEEAGSKHAYSISGENEFDCKAKKYRNLSLTRYSDHMATGEVLSATEGSGEWSKIPPRSKVARMFRTVCNAPARPVDAAVPVYFESFRRLGSR